MDITLSVIDKAGSIRASKTSCDAVSLIYETAYQDGDRIHVELPEPGRFVTLSLDNALPPATLFIKERQFSLPVPHGATRKTYAPVAFEGAFHRLSARLAFSEEISSTRNLALNPFDHSRNTTAFPHASATVETRDEAAFAARNAIDGETASDNHGFWPFTSWGINCDPEAALTIDFGRAVSVETVVLFTRADFPHDAWWTQAKVTLSDGWTCNVPLGKTGAGQRFALPHRRTEWLKLDGLIKADDPSPFPALTQIEIWGCDT